MRSMGRFLADPLTLSVANSWRTGVYLSSGTLGWFWWRRLLMPISHVLSRCLKSNSPL